MKAAMKHVDQHHLYHRFLFFNLFLNPLNVVYNHLGL